MPPEEDVLADETGGTENVVPKKNPDPVPYSRFREVVQQRRELETRLQTVESALSAAETDKHAALKKFSDLEASTNAVLDDLKAQIAARDAEMQKYKETVSSVVDETITEWPEEVMSFDPGSDADPIARLEWAKKAKLLVAKFNGGQQSSAGAGQKPTPKQPVTEPKQIHPDIDVKRSF